MLRARFLLTTRDILPEVSLREVKGEPLTGVSWPINSSNPSTALSTLPQMPPYTQVYTWHVDNCPLHVTSRFIRHGPSV